MWEGGTVTVGHQLRGSSKKDFIMSTLTWHGARQNDTVYSNIVCCQNWITLYLHGKTAFDAEAIVPLETLHFALLSLNNDKYFFCCRNMK